MAISADSCIADIFASQQISNIVLSLTYIVHGVDISLMWTKKFGPDKVPWGAPLGDVDSDSELPIFTLCFLSGQSKTRTADYGLRTGYKTRTKV